MEPPKHGHYHHGHDGHHPVAGDSVAPEDEGHESHDVHAGHSAPGGRDEHAGHAAHEGHDKHAGHSVSMFRDRFWLSLVMAIPTLVWSPMLQEWFSYSAPAVPGARLIPPFFGTLVFVYGGNVFLVGAWRELRARLPGMMTLISLAITVAFAYSFAVTLGWDGESLWWELATLVVIMLLGHWIEMRSIGQAQGALKELAKLLPDTAERVVGAGTETVKVSDLVDGDLVLIRPGASIPADGVVEEGRSGVDEAEPTTSAQVRARAPPAVRAATASSASSPGPAPYQPSTVAAAPLAIHPNLDSALTILAGLPAPRFG